MRTCYLFIVLIPVLISCESNNQTHEIKPERMDITESVYASVKVVPEFTYHPQAISSGILAKLHVTEGSLVRKGQVIFEIEPAVDMFSKVNNAEINMKEARANYSGQNNLLKNIGLEIETTKEQLKLDSMNLARQKRLTDQNIGKRLDYDQQKLQFQNTKNQLAILKQHYIQTKSTLENNYKKALNSINSEKMRLADYNVLSKVDGKVYLISKEVGDLINTQEKFIEIGSSDHFKIEMDIDEVDITKIELGDTVLITLNAFKKDVFLALVSKISPKKNDVTQTFSVESEFEDLPSKLYYGLAGEANIIISKKKNALVIPASYLLNNNKVLTGDGEKSVVIGMKNLDFVEILSSLDTSSIIIKPEM